MEVGRGKSKIQWKHLERSLHTPPPVALGDSRGWSFLLVIIAGTGRPTSDLTSKLLNQLWVLLLHLLSKLLATVREVPGSAGPAHTRQAPPTIIWRCSPGIRHESPMCSPQGQCGHSLKDTELTFPLSHVECPCPPTASPLCRSTHAWMRLARSFCEGLVPGVPRGLWLPEIIPDMLEEENL